MIIGYCRVSTKDQDLTRQIESLKEYGCEKIYCDKATGKNFNRPEYIALKNALRKGDTLVVHEFDRLGRNKKLTLKELQYFKDNGIRLVALNLPTTQMNTNDNLMLETINNIVIELYTMIAQQEIETREKRQKEGIKVALENGVKFGRNEIEYPKEWKTVYSMVQNKEITNVKAMQMLDLKKTTYFKLKKQYEESNQEETTVTTKKYKDPYGKDLNKLSIEELKQRISLKESIIKSQNVKETSGIYKEYKILVNRLKELED